MGGQIGDCGIINSDKGNFVVETTEKSAECVIHWGKVALKELSPSAIKVTASVAKKERNKEKSYSNAPATVGLASGSRRICHATR